MSTVAVRASELLAATLAAGAICVVVALAGTCWLTRRLRRRLKGTGRAVAERAAGAGIGAASAGRRWLWSRPVPDRRWLAAGRARRRLWRAVGAAGHAVVQARGAGAPTGDLDALCHRLRQAAAQTDRSLAMAGRATPGNQPGPASSQVNDLVLTATLIQDAAASALASMSQPAVSTLADDVRREAVALSAGTAAAARAHQAA